MREVTRIGRCEPFVYGILRHAAQIALWKKFTAGKEPTLSTDPFLGSQTSNFGASRIARVRIPRE